VAGCRTLPVRKIGEAAKPVLTLMRLRLDEFFQAASETSKSIKESLAEANGQKNAFMTRHGKDLFQFYEGDQERAARFASAMAGLSRRTHAQPDYLLLHTEPNTVERHFDSLKESFPWGSIAGRKVIDVGGGSGHMSVSLARVRFFSP
jgi:2-polyprenyl-3-methyl-5-hydroxy-6-metoxy-1,4-benzoquinol methylase